MFRPGPARVTLALLLMLGGAGAARGISLDMDFAGPAGLDVTLRWESEGAGPFTLRTWDIQGSGRVADALQADPDGDVAASGIPGGPLGMSGEALLPAGIGLRAYQLVDESDGSCSNLGYVALRRSLVAEEAHVLAIPARSSVRTLEDVLDRYPAVRRVELVQPAACLRTAMERVAGGRRGVDAFIPAGKAVQVTLSRDMDLVVVGASGSRHEGTPVDLNVGPCLNLVANEDFISYPFGVDWRTSDDLLCGREGFDWFDADLDGHPDTCQAGVFDGTNGVAVLLGRRNGASELALRGAGNFGGFVFFGGERFALDPVAGSSAAMEALGRDPPSVMLATGDAGAPPACRCADGDGDGDDDCTERLMGTDPADPSSRGPDHDRDGVRDGDDDCPADADPLQQDLDGDGFGDACDPDPADPANQVVDPDLDGILDGVDICPDTADPDQQDVDADGFGDACDNCPEQISNQADSDGDGEGDACDPCPIDPTPDADGDFACSDDNCPRVHNFDQQDTDGDGFGNACECAAVPELLPEVHELRVGFVGGAARILRRLSWLDERSLLPGHVEDTVFDIRGGSLETLRTERSLRPGACVKSGLRDAFYVEGPAFGSNWYLVRMRSACAYGELGDAGPPGGPNPRREIERAAGWYCP